MYLVNASLQFAIVSADEIILLVPAVWGSNCKKWRNTIFCFKTHDIHTQKWLFHLKLPFSWNCKGGLKNCSSRTQSCFRPIPAHATHGTVVRISECTTLVFPFHSFLSRIIFYNDNLKIEC